MSTARKTKEFSTLEELRVQIDQVDTELVKLLEQRARLVFAVGELKRHQSLPTYDSKRESAIKARIRKLTSSNGPLSPTEMSSVFMAIVERFRSLESAHRHIAAAVELFPSCSLNFTGPQNVVLWGFGLLGASVYLALNEVCPQWKFQVIDPLIDNPAFLQWKNANRHTNIELADEACIKGGQLFILGAPVDANNRNLSNAEFPPGSLVIDLGSTKQSTMNAFERRSAGYGGPAFTFVGGHPLAGKEVAGFQNGDAQLFHNKVFYWIAPVRQEMSESEKTTCDALALCLGARPRWCSAAEHDQALAWTSHLPQLLSSLFAGLFRTKAFSDDDDFFPGYISQLLRISGSPFSRWQPIFSSNAPATDEALKELIQALTTIREKMRDPAALKALFDESNEFYHRFNERKEKRN